MGTSAGIQQTPNGRAQKNITSSKKKKKKKKIENGVKNLGS